jgi:HAD superfamily hydrolase (TIGR01549 family)
LSIAVHRLPEQISTVLFDVGNTLHHLDHAFIAAAVSRHSHTVEATQVAIAEYTAKAAIDAQFRARAAGSDAGRRLSYFEIILDALSVAADATAAIIAELHAEDVRESLWRVMEPDTPRVIGELRRRGFALAVVSNADGRVSAALAARGTAAHFTTIVDSHVVGIEKPDARIFEIALAACQAQPSEAVYVGDIYEVDVRGARNAGIAPVLLDPLSRYGEVDCPRIAALAQLIDLLPASAARAWPPVGLGSPSSDPAGSGP